MPKATTTTGGSHVTEKRLGGKSGAGFMPGKSGNPGGRPKGARTLIYDVRAMMARAITEPELAEALRTVEKNAIDRIRDNLQQRKTVVSTLEFAARLNREIGLGSGESAAGVTIIFASNIRPRAPRKSA